MDLNEFSFIERLKELTPKHQHCLLGIGDDAAVLTLPPAQQLVTCIDTLVAGTHFPKHIAADDLAYRALAVNLSDLAAMAATPAWFCLALTLPALDNDWLNGFCQGLQTTASQYGIQLIGGDTTQGPLTISIQMFGFVKAGQAITRSGAQAGDPLFVSGHLGDAGAALAYLNTPLQQLSLDQQDLLKRYYRPTPRIELAQQLAPFASSMIDISDGLVSEVRHLCQQSQLGATIFSEHIPYSPALRRDCGSHEQALSYALSTGDAYELCFTANEKHQDQLQAIAKQHAIAITPIGYMTTERSLKILNEQKQLISLPSEGFRHFDPTQN